MYIYHNITIKDALGAMCKAIPHSRRKLLLDLAKNAVSGNSERHPKKEIRLKRRFGAYADHPGRGIRGGVVGYGHGCDICVDHLLHPQ